MYFAICTLLLQVVSYSYCNDMQTGKLMGQYDFELKYADDCIPKKKKSNLIHTTLEIKENKNHEQIFFGKFWFLRDIGPLKATIRGSILIGDRYKPMLNTQFSNICNEKFIQNVIKKTFNLDKRCRISKGNYTLEENISRITKDVLGDIFFYGKFKFKFHIISNDLIIMCREIEGEFKKKKSK